MTLKDVMLQEVGKVDGNSHLYKAMMHLLMYLETKESPIEEEKDSEIALSAAFSKKYKDTEMIGTTN